MTVPSITRVVSAALAAIVLASCGGTTPAAPSLLSSVFGVVREQFGVQSPGIAGATVTITSGAQAGRAVTTGPDGSFAFKGVSSEPMQVRVAAEGFETVTGELAADALGAQFLLAPLTTVVERSFAPADRTADVPFTVGRRGPVTLRLSSDQKYCELSYQAVFWAQVNDRFGLGVCPPGPLTVEQTEILDPGQYSVRVHMLRVSSESNGKRELYVRYPR